MSEQEDMKRKIWRLEKHNTELLARLKIARTTPAATPPSGHGLIIPRDAFDKFIAVCENPPEPTQALRDMVAKFGRFAVDAPSDSAGAMREALKEAISQLEPFAEDGDQPAISAAIDAGRAALAAAPQPQEGREAIMAECAEIADKYSDCGGSFIAQKIRDATLVSRPMQAPGE